MKTKLIHIVTKTSAGLVVGVLAGLLGACAFTDGNPWGQAEMTLEAAFDASSRLDDDGHLRTVKNYDVRIDSIEVHLDILSLSMSAGGSVTLSFDPANPPEGYSTCHGGHCHSDDGRLVAYEDIEAELAGGSASAGFRLTRIIEADVALSQSPTAVPLRDCPDNCQLEQGTLSTIELIVPKLQFEGRVFDQLEGDARRLPEEGVPVTGTVILDLTFESAVTGSIGDGHPIVVRLDSRFDLPPQLFDGIEWADVLPAGGSSTPVDVSNATGFAESVTAEIESHATFTVANQPEDEHEHEHELEEGVCTHLQNGPFETVDATADSSDQLDDVAIPHTAVTVNLVEITGGNGGWVSFGAAADTEFAFFLTADVAFAMVDAHGVEVDFEHSEIGSEVCDTIGAQYHADLSVGTYKLSFGPATETAVTLVSAEVGEHHHE